MKERLILFIKGVILGIAFIIPGVSGGTLAVLLGIYEDLIKAINNFYKGFKNFKKYFLYLLPIGLGALFSILLVAKVIKLGLEHAPIITILVFLGLIIGGVPKIFRAVDKKLELKDFSLMLIGIIIVLAMSIIDKGTNVNFDNMNTVSYLLLFLVGVLASTTMVVPGISGSLTLMLIGYYEPILNTVNNLTTLTNMKENLLIFVPFLLGVVVGILLIAKIIEYCLEHYKETTYLIIIGFVIASIISLFISVCAYEMNIIHFIIGLILMCLNAVLVYKVFDK